MLTQRIGGCVIVFERFVRRPKISDLTASFFLQPLQPQTRPLHRRHFFRTLHAFPFSDVVLGAATTDTQLTTQLANGNTRIFDILGHTSTPRRALGRQALLPVAGIGALTLLFRIKLHMGRYRADENVRVT